MSSFGGEKSDDDSVTEVPLTSSFRPPVSWLRAITECFLKHVNVIQRVDLQFLT